MIFNGQRSGNPLLNGPPEVVADPRAYIAHPGRPNPGDTTPADKLIKKHIRNRADEGQVSDALADDFVSGGKGDQSFQRGPQGNRLARCYIPGDGFR